MVTRASIRCVGIFLICLTIFNFVQLVFSTSNEVTTELGKITGSIEDVFVYDENGIPTTIRYVQYLGIPYAEPPTDDRRFRKPVAKTPWSIPHNGTFHRPMCIQSPTILSGPIAIKDGDMSEDCLTLDIYAPIGSITNEGPYPVLMFLFGASGGSQGFVGDALSAYGDVIVVVINTRTEMIGYFSTGDESAPGNFGLWDEKMALHWVYDHISNFDGDKNRISLAGFSMGGSNAILQALHPDNKGIIKGVIALGGTPFPTHKASNFVKKPNGMEFIESVGCKSGSSKKIVECMRKKSLSDLYAGLGSLPYSLSFTPVVDGDFIIAEPYTILTGTDSNLTAAKEAFGSVNLMSGLSNMEGGVHIVLMWSNILNKQSDVFALNKTEFAVSVVPTAMDIIFGKNVPDAVVQNVVYQYSDLKDPDNIIKLRQSVVDLSTDIDVATPILKTAKFHHRISTKKTYLYQFSANMSLDTVLTPTWLEGANHGTEVYFVLGLSDRNMEAWTHSTGHVPSPIERTTSAKMMRLISNFVKSGNPNTPVNLEPDVPDWQPYNDKTSPYLDISHDQISANQYFREPQMTFWTNIVPSLLQMSENTKDTKEEEPSCNCEHKESDPSLWFNLKARVAENVILTLTIMCGCFILAFLLVCLLTVARQNSGEYNVKSANKM